MNDSDLFESSAQLMKGEADKDLKKYTEHELCLCGHSFRMHECPPDSPCYISECYCQEFKLK